MAKTTVNDLYTVFEKNGLQELATRVAAFKDAEKKIQVAGLEELIHDCKQGAVKYPPAALKTIKHVYRDLTS